ncbi:efflux RND transporter periplasmic adaptor subunit [uncultured Agathobaculum sp.]|uniref:efflux RND transporter periplasmic adaptor subunit n=1 Tax=uncultured Agathobaculum sp. TaxID=2048140 RepID=UPI00296E54C1
MNNSKRILAAMLAGAMVLCAGCGKEEETEEETATGTAVEVTDVAAGSMSTENTLNGKVVAVNEVQVFPLLAGQVQVLNVSEGDTVSKGQTLFTVDTSTVTSTMSALQQSYSATKTATDRAIESARIGVEQAELAVSNTEALLEAGAAAEQDLTKAKQALTQAQAGVAQAQAQQSASLAQIQASMDQINKQASLGTVTAPCSGTVTAVNVVQGGMASSAQPGVVIAENGSVEVQVSVAEDVFTGIKAGDTASVLVSAVSAEPMNGTVSALPAAANAQTNLYDVSVSLPSGAKPPIGAFASVTFYTDRRVSTLSVPTECILTGNNNEQYVFTVDESGTTATRVTVTTGLVSKTDTEVVSGLKAGDKVVTKGQSYLSDGAAVRVVTSDTADGGEG